MGVGAAIGGAALIGGAATVYGAQSAAGAQESAANQANQTEQGFFNTTNQALSPYIQAGQQATNQITNLEGLGTNGNAGIASTLQSLPGYQFANQPPNPSPDTKGLESVQNSATARGLGISGAGQKAAANYSTGLANTYYNNLLTGLQQTASTGAGSGAALGGAATSLGSSIGGNIVGAGNAAAAASNATGSAISSAANSVPSGLIASSLLQGIGNNSATTTGIYDSAGNIVNGGISNPFVSGDGFGATGFGLY